MDTSIPMKFPKYAVIVRRVFYQMLFVSHFYLEGNAPCRTEQTSSNVLAFGRLLLINIETLVSSLPQGTCSPSRCSGVVKKEKSCGNASRLEACSFGSGSAL